MKKNLVSLVLLLGALMLPAAVHAQNIYGDVNGDLEVNIADINSVIDIILDGNDFTPAADVNGDGEINIADVNSIINIILGEGVPSQEHEWVDLGLPSGTLWATCNVGANAPEEYGDYFAWGETEPKEVYESDTYKWYESDNNYSGYTKYCTNSRYGYNGFTDGKTELDPEDDAAYVNWGTSWRMPTSEQQQELINNCNWTWTTQNGVNGRLVTGPNGASLFLPVTGIRWGSSLNQDGLAGYYLSRTLYSSAALCAYGCGFTSSRVWYDDAPGRLFGLTVRAVRVPQN